MAVIEGLMAIHLLHRLYFSVVTNVYYNAFNANKEVKLLELKFYFSNTKTCLHKWKQKSVI